MDGHDYRIATLDARKQFHIVRRMLPVISGIAAGGEALDKIAECVGKLSDEDADYVLFGLLSAVSAQRCCSWQKQKGCNIGDCSPSGGWVEGSFTPSAIDAVD